MVEIKKDEPTPCLFEMIVQGPKQSLGGCEAGSEGAVYPGTMSEYAE